ncbi:MAG: hypothetical protein AAF633_14750 [Chloroflexota bacterium]
MPLEEIDAVETLDDLLGKQLLHETTNPLSLPYHDPVYSFTHQKVSDVVYATASTARRRMLHRRAFQALQANNAAAADCAHHAFQAGLQEETIRYSLIAGNEALDLVVIPVALTHFQTIRQLTEQQGWPETISGADKQLFFVGLSRAYELAEEWPKAKETYAAMIEYAQTIGAYAMECLGINRMANESQRAIGYSQLLYGKPQAALATLEKAAAFCRQIENFWGASELKWKVAHAQLECGQYGQAIKLANEGIKMTRQLGIPEVLDLALVIASLVYRKIMALDAAKEKALDIVKVAAERQVYEMILEQTLIELCAANALSGDWEEAFALSQQRLQLVAGSSLAPASLYGWYETEALLRGGREDLARMEIKRVAGIIGENRRFYLPLLRSRAVLAQWNGEVDQAINHLETALALAHDIGLPGEEWPILGELGKLYAEQEEKEKSREAYGEAAVIIRRLVETIDDVGLQKGFLTSLSVRSVLEKNKLQN